MASRTIKPWNALPFFQGLTAQNKLCREKGFKCVPVSGLEGMETAIASMQNHPNLIMVAENAAGFTELSNTPHVTKYRTVFIAMRHKHDDMTARQNCMDIIFEIHRQFCSKLIQEDTRLKENYQYLDTRITLQEVSKYLVPDTAICMFELGVNTFIDLEPNPDEWITETSN